MGEGRVDEELRERNPRIDKVITVFSSYNFDRLLDIGCADGEISMILKNALNAKEVYGIDINEESLRMARKRGVKAFQLDISKEEVFPFEDNYFDAIFAGEIIEHLYDTDHFLDEVYRTLKGGGVFA